MRRVVLMFCGATVAACGAVAIACGQFGADETTSTPTPPDASQPIEQPDGAGEPVITDEALDSGAGSLDATASTTYGKEVLADQPLGYWRMAVVDKGVVPNVLPQKPGLAIGETSKAKLVAGPLSEPGDQALAIDGTFLSAPSSALYDFKDEDEFTIEAWGKLTGKLTAQTPLFTKLSVGVNVILQKTCDGYWVGFDEKSQVEAIYGSGTGFLQATTKAGAATDWHHYALVVDTNVTLYVDGIVAKQEKVKNRPDSNFPPRFSVAGQSGADFVPKFVGIVDEVAIYARPLFGERIKAHFDAAHTVAP